MRAVVSRSPPAPPHPESAARALAAAPCQFDVAIEVVSGRGIPARHVTVARAEDVAFMIHILLST